ncbi:hypothetical protein F4818DRAFT_419889 [Hypoxylon cercidicola]|nr:hypothetical protein F4818DRAFT_419889 [Hypoxylon cercidicola]
MGTTVGIAGITSRVALCAVRQLLKRPDVYIRGYCRNPNKLPVQVSSHPRVQLLQGQFDDGIALRSLVKGCDVVICSYLADDNNVMVEGQKLLIDLCVEEGVPRYIPSDYTIEFPKLRLGQFIKKNPMIQINEYLESKNIKAAHILVGIFMETLFSDLLYIWDPKERTIQYYGSGDEVLELSTYDTAGRYLAAVAVDPEAVGFLRFLGDRKSTNQIISDFRSVYGTEPAVKRLGSLDDLYQEAHANGEQHYAKTGLHHILTGAVYLEGDLDCGRYPDVKPETMQDLFKQHPISQLHQALDLVATKWD